MQKFVEIRNVLRGRRARQVKFINRGEDWKIFIDEKDMISKYGGSIFDENLFLNESTPGIY
jgi:hypothetical protein